MLQVRMAKSLVLSRTDDNDEETFLVIGIDFGTSYAKCFCSVLRWQEITDR